jgi:hypothetical protein
MQRTAENATGARFVITGLDPVIHAFFSAPIG